MSVTIKWLNVHVDTIMDALATTRFGIEQAISTHEQNVLADCGRPEPICLRALQGPVRGPTKTEQLLLNTIHHAGSQAADAVILLANAFAVQYSIDARAAALDCEVIFETRAELDDLLLKIGRQLKEYSNHDPVSSLERLKSAVRRAPKSPLLYLNDLINFRTAPATVLKGRWALQARS